MGKTVHAKRRSPGSIEVTGPKSPNMDKLPKENRCPGPMVLDHGLGLDIGSKIHSGILYGRRIA